MRTTKADDSEGAHRGFVRVHSFDSVVSAYSVRVREDALLDC